MYPQAKRDMTAELVVYMVDGLFHYNAAYVTDGGICNTRGGWQSFGHYPNIHEALTEGREFWEDAKREGFKKGARTVPWLFKSQAA